MEAKIDIQFPEGQVRQILTEVVREELARHFPKQDRLIPRLQSCKAFNVTPPTWDKWAFEGVFNTIKVGGKVFIKESEQNRILSQSRFQ